MPKVRHHVTIEELQSMVEYNEHTGHFYWKECNNLGYLDGYNRLGWHHRKAGTRADRPHQHSKRADPSMRILLFGALLSAPQAAYMIKVSTKPKRVYHVDGNPLNNRWSNLTLENPRQPSSQDIGYKAVIKGNKISFRKF